VLVANFRHQSAEVLKKCHVVRNRVAIGQYPLGIFEHEIDQRRHVIPAAQVQSQTVIAQVEEKFLHLVGERVRFHQRHALDVILGQAFGIREGLEEIAPPQRLFGGFTLRDVDGKIVRQPSRIDLVPDQSQIEERGRYDLVLDDPALADVQTAGAHPGHGFRALHCDFFISLFVVVAEFVLVGGDRILHRQHDVIPEVRGGILQVDHHRGRS